MKATKRAQPSRIRSEKSSGNVFADLGLPRPEQELLKSRLTLQIYRLIRAHDLQTGRGWEDPGHQATACVGAPAQPLGILSVERLMEFLTALGTGCGD